MGSGGAKAHESYSVSPAHAAAVEAGIEAVPGSELSTPGSAAAVEQALEELANVAVDPASTYEDLASAAGQVLEAHAQAVEDGWAEQLASESLKQLKKQTTAWLGQHSPEELQALAAAQGFEHPSLVGLNGGEDEQHPLVHWLDPAYGPTTPSKLKIQAKATERYAKLAAGGTLAGMTLVDVQAKEASLAQPPPAGAWQATPPQVVGAMAAVNQAVAALDLHHVPSGGEGGLGELVAAENRLAAAQCAEMGTELDAAKASARAAVDKALESSGYARRAAIAQVVADARGAGSIGEAEETLLSPDQQLDLLRLSTPAAHRTSLGKLAAEREGQVAKLKELRGAYLEGKAALSSLDVGEASGKAALVALSGTAGDYFGHRKKVGEWATEAAGHAGLKEELGPLNPSAYAYGHDAAGLTSTFRAWAKGQKLPHLRAVAQSLGMETAGASRAQIQNFIAASWDPKHDKAQIQAAASAKSASPTKPAPAGPKTVTPKTAPLSGGTGVGIPSAKSFAAKHAQVVATLKAHQAVATDLPTRPTEADVDGWEFGPGQTAALGGAHAKTLHAAPDGSMWLFKPDKQKGARASAEAAASEVFHRVGVPSVGVYTKRIGKRVGSIQPLVSGATQLSADPSSWSQADLDSIVRYHVAAWAVGDHDGNHTNLLRTPSGGLLPVDQGQAFKFYGRDRLDTSYHPNGSYGAAPPVFHQAYAAASGGKLGPGVSVRPEAALPVIKAFERLPDSQYRAMLRPTAAEGVKRKVHWVEPVRKAAKKRLKKTQVSDAEVAEEFLRQAVERKNGLRKAFAGFFAGLGFGGAGKLEKVA